MRSSKSLMIAAAVIGVVAGGPLAYAQAKGALAIADNQGFLVDGKVFTIVPGTIRRDASDLIERLDARRLGAGAIIFRSGDSLYIAEGPPVPNNANARYGGSKNDYGSDRYGGSKNDYGSDRYGGSKNDYGSDRYGSDRYGSDRYGSDRYGSDRYGSDRYGSDRYGSDRYGSDRYGSDRDSSASPAQAERDWREWQDSLRRGGYRAYGSDRYGSDRITINDSDYVAFRLKQLFEENWSPPDAN